MRQVAKRIEAALQKKNKEMAPPKKPSTSTFEEADTGARRKTLRDKPTGKDKQAAKRSRKEDESSDDELNKSTEAAVLEIVGMLDRGGVDKDLIQQVREKIMQSFRTLLDEQELRIRKMNREDRERERYLERCSRSIIIHNADKLEKKIGRAHV